MNALLAPSQPRRHVENWRRYYEIVCERPSSCLAELALREVVNRGSALDLGAGAMNDPRRFLEEGFGLVTALDESPDALPYATCLARSFPERFSFEECPFADYRFEPASFDLIHSNFGLSYIDKSELEPVMSAIKASLRPKGVLSCTLFGSYDGWRSRIPNLAYLTEGEVRRLLSGLVDVDIRPVSHDAGLYDGTPKSWHYYRILARKP